MLALLGFAGAAQAVDTTAPTGTLTPANTAQVDDINVISGTATDSDSGVSTIKVRLVRNWTGNNEWWNGSAWTGSVFDLPYTKSAPDANGQVTWQTTAAATVNLPAQLPPSRYIVQAIITDASNNSVTLSSTVSLKPVDGVIPTTTISYPPSNNMSFSRLPMFLGTALDPENSPGIPGSGVARVTVWLRRVTLSNNQTVYWNGTAWVSGATTFMSSADTSWARGSGFPLPNTANLPLSGESTYQYSLVAFAVDRFNLNATQVVRNFKVVGNVMPDGEAQSVLAARNVARPITLTTDEDENDVLTYNYTQPSHGTLTGTAPNLIYTPASNYTGTDSFSFTPSDWEGAGSAATVSINVVDDTVNPTVAISNPAANAHLTGTMSVFEGTATDAGSGIASVSLQLTRDWTGTVKYWTGSTWSTTTTSIESALDIPDGAGELDWDWPSTIAFPTGGHFPIGRYTARATARDYANRTAAVTRVFYNGNDATPPTGTLVPMNPSKIYANTELTENGQSIFNGTAKDIGPAGENTLGRIHFRLVRPWTGVNEYWTGSTWSTTLPQLGVTSSAPDTNGEVSWQVTSNMPSGDIDLLPGRYVAQAIINDTSNNTTSFSSTFYVLPKDEKNPDLSVTFPTEGANLSRLDRIQGTAVDLDDGATPASGLSLINVRLRRVNGGQTQYWNGAAWTASDFILTPRTEFSWIRNTNLPSGGNLPAGAYIISAQAVDRYNNSSTVVTRNFNIVIPPTAAGQTLSTPKNTALSVTLSGTDPGSLPLTYSVVSPPSHGTLTGTAPNLTYTPTTNYFGGDSFQFKVNNGLIDSENALVVVNVLPLPYPDGQIKWWNSVNFTGANVFNVNGAGQISEARTITSTPATPAVYLWRVRNVSTATGTFNLTGTGGGNGWSVKYYDVTTSTEITSSVVSTGWTTPSILGSEYRDIQVEVTPDASVALGGTREVLMAATHTSSGAADVVRAVTGKQALIEWNSTITDGGNTIGAIDCLGIRRVLPDDTGKWLLESNLAYDTDFKVASDNGQTLSITRNTDPCSYTWTVTRAGYPTLTFTGQHTYWTPPAAGTYTVTLVVDDGNGGNQTLREIGSRNDASPAQNLTNDPPIVFTVQAIVP